jgi:hypothetical protein
MGGYSKHSGAAGFKIGTIGTQYSPGNHVRHGGEYHPKGSFFDATGRERRIGPTFLALSHHKSVAHGPRRSELPDHALAPTGFMYGRPHPNVPGTRTMMAHTEAPPQHSYNLRSLVHTPWSMHAKVHEAEL